MNFTAYDALRTFLRVARLGSVTAAAAELHRSKGAISYQLKLLEQDLGFAVFQRLGRGLVPTERGRALAQAAEAALGGLEGEIRRLRAEDLGRITLGLATYVASRWLSPRLMRFTSARPEVVLRLQPLTDLIDLTAHDIDLAIRWGRGEWTDLAVERLFPCPAFPTAGRDLAARIEREGLAKVLPDAILLHDRDDSRAWQDWFQAAGLIFSSRQESLVIPDPNVRVQAVIDGQGLALNDALVAAELAEGRLHRVSPVALEDYGYFLVYPPGALERPALRALRDWLLEEAATQISA